MYLVATKFLGSLTVDCISSKMRKSEFVIRFFLFFTSISLITVAKAKQLEGMDISLYQGRIDYKKVTPKSTGLQFIILRSSIGTSKDPYFVSNCKGASNAGFAVAAYHFLLLNDSSDGFVQKQMDVAIAQFNQVTSTKPIMLALDVESYDNKTDYKKNTQTVILKSIAYLKKVKNIVPYIYTVASFWDLYVPKTPPTILKCKLWVARWRDKAPAANELPNGWKAWTIWQYTSQGNVPGISGYVDKDKWMM